MSGEIPYASPEILDRHLEPTHLTLLFDAFRQVLPFGTGGRRGPVGYGPNRMNPSTVAMTAQGHSDYLKSHAPGQALSVVVANDVRVFTDNGGVYGFLGPDHPLLGVSSRFLARLACEIYAANGIAAYLAAPEDDRARSPARRSFPSSSSSSTRPAGSTYRRPTTRRTTTASRSTTVTAASPSHPRTSAWWTPWNGRRKCGGCPSRRASGREWSAPCPRSSTPRTWTRTSGSTGTCARPIPGSPVVYTPLCGCGVNTVKDVLEQLGFSLRIPPDQGLDGSFAAIPFKAPNPEVPHATAPAREFADRHGIGIVLSSDPDADRIGMEARLAGGSWYHFDGNQIAAILCHHLMLDPQGPRRRGLVMETLVTTRLLGRIVAEAGDSWLIDDLLVGFKYVAEVLKTLERSGRYRDIACSPEDLVLAAEESHGVVMAPGIRDKDATPACMVLAALYQRLLDEDRTMLDYYADMIRELGSYDNVNRSVTLGGSGGDAQEGPDHGQPQGSSAAGAGGAARCAVSWTTGTRTASDPSPATPTGCRVTSCKPTRTTSSSPCGRRAPNPS